MVFPQTQQSFRILLHRRHPVRVLPAMDLPAHPLHLVPLPSLRVSNVINMFKQLEHVEDPDAKSNKD